MRIGTSTAPAASACQGFVIVNTPDGPEVAACLDPCCTNPAGEKFRARADVRSNGFTNAMLAQLDDEGAF